MATVGSLEWDEQATGANENTWGEVANENFRILDLAIAGYVAVATTGGTVILTSEQNRNAVIRLTGILASNATIEVLTKEKNWVFINHTTGAFTLTVKTNAGTGKVIPQGRATRLYCDGTNVAHARTEQLPAAAASGTDTITATMTPAITSADLTDGFICIVESAGANTGAVTFNPNATGALDVRTHGGTALIAGDIPAANYKMILCYDASSTRWELLNPAGLATATKRGLVTLATTAEAQAMTDTAKAITAAALGALMNKGSNIAAASTLSAGDGGFFFVSGSGSSISDIDFATASADGRSAVFYFNGANTLVHSSSLNLPGNANITTAQGDMLIVWQYASDDVKTAYLRTNGRPVVETWEKVGADLEASGSATLTSGDCSAYRVLRITLTGIRPVQDDDEFRMRIGTDASTFKATDYEGIQFLDTNAAAGAGTVAPTDGTITGQAANAGVGNTVNDGPVQGTIMIHNFNTARDTAIFADIIYGNPAGSFRNARSKLLQKDATANSHVRFSFLGDNIAAGTITIEGLR